MRLALQRTPRLATLTAACALALAGCGSASSTTATTARTIAPVGFNSAAVAGKSLPGRYTCDGSDVTPPFHWGNVPAHTGELLLAAVGFKRTRTGSYLASVEWALAGLDPKLHDLRTGERPKGAYLGLNSRKRHDYSICPPRGAATRHQFMLFAVPDTLKVSRAFDALEILGALSRPGTEDSAIGEGSFTAYYKRG